MSLLSDSILDKFTVKFEQTFNGDAARKAIEDAAHATVDRVAVFIARRAKERCPVDTGHMRSQVYIEPSQSPTSRRVVVSTYYAGFVEFGHATHSGGFVPPQPFLRLAVQDAAAFWPSLVVKVGVHWGAGQEEGW